MKRFIFNTEGTGISHEQIRRLEDTQPGSGTYLESDMSGHPLGDEIMLLDGLEDMTDVGALEALGYVGSGNYRSRAVDMNGFSMGAAELAAVPRKRRANRDFEPWGLGQMQAERGGRPIVIPNVGSRKVALPAIRARARGVVTPSDVVAGRPSQMANRTKADLRRLRTGAGGRSHPAGRRLRKDFQPWGLGDAAVSPYTAEKGARPDLFIGPNYLPFQDLPTPNVMRAGREFEPWGLGTQPVEYGNTPPPQSFLYGFAEPGVRMLALGGESYEKWADTPDPGTWFDGLEDAAADRRAALAIAGSTRDACRSACGLIRERNATETSAAQGRCRAGCDTAYNAAVTAINAALPPGTTGPASTADTDVINAKLDALARARAEAEAGQVPTGTSEDEGLTTTQWLLIGGGVLGLGALAIFALRR